MRYVVTVRGTLKGTEQQAREAHDATVRKISPTGKSMGNTSHQAYQDIKNPKEFFAIDVWDNLESIQKLYGDPKLGEEFGKLFDSMPTVTVWKDTGWFQF